MQQPHALTNTPYISSREIAERLGIKESSARSQMRAMRGRKKNPVDLRVPHHLAPMDVGRHVSLYWRDEVESWMQARAERKSRGRK